MKKKMFAIIMAVLLLVMSVPFAGVAEASTTVSNVKYIDANGTEQTCSSAT